jgi:hypothetical protein
MSPKNCSSLIDVSENKYICRLLAVQGTYLWFLGAYAKQCEQRLLASSCTLMSVVLAVCLIALKNSASTGRNFIKIFIGCFH